MPSILQTINPRSNAEGLKDLESFYILKLRAEVTNYDDASERIIIWAKQGERGYITASSVHGTVESFISKKYCKVINHSRLNTTDGMPLVVAQKLLGAKKRKPGRVYGPTLTLHICEKVAKHKIPIALYGGSPQSIIDFQKNLELKYPGINIVKAISPPFRQCTKEEDALFTNEINSSGAKVVFVGIGCPKQDYWMHEHEAKIDAILVGVGAAFDFHSGRVKQAPSFLQKISLEWLFRLCMEPNRLWKRYISIVPRFILFFPVQFIMQIFNFDIYNIRSIKQLFDKASVEV